MDWKSYVSEAPLSTDAIRELRERIDPDQASVALIFATSHHTTHFGLVAHELRKLGVDVVVGCSGMGVIGAQREVEHQPGLAVLVGHLPGVEIETTHTAVPSLPDGFLDNAAGVIVLADSFTSPTDALLRHIDSVAPETKVFGGLASGGLFPGAHALYDNREIRNNGAVCVKFSGDITIDTLVAQGCTPIGEPLIVTKRSENLILEFDRGRPVDVLSALLESRERPQKGLFVGLNLVDRPDGEYLPEDFLVRTFMGIEPNSGAIAVGETLHEHQVVQFHVRDNETSSNDVRAQLERYAATGHKPSGALLFTCVGRGRGLYGASNHDVDAMTSIVGEIPVGGFFCNGEIGRVGDRAFIHGYTSSFAFFRPRGPSEQPQ